MTLLADSLTLSGMARKKDAPKSTTKRHPASFRFEEAFLDRIERFAENNPLRPTVTRIIELAVTEWLDKHEAGDRKPK